MVVESSVGHCGCEVECRAFFDGAVEVCLQYTASRFDPCIHLHGVARPGYRDKVVEIRRDRLCLGEFSCTSRGPCNPFDSTLQRPSPTSQSAI